MYLYYAILKFYFLFLVKLDIGIIKNFTSYSINRIHTYKNIHSI